MDSTLYKFIMKCTYITSVFFNCYYMCIVVSVVCIRNLDLEIKHFISNLKTVFINNLVQ